MAITSSIHVAFGKLNRALRYTHITIDKNRLALVKCKLGVKCYANEKFRDP